jgi:hypothetical protein
MNKQIDEIFQQVLDEDCADPLRRFAELVAADEREACAKLCENEYKIRLAETIRARGRK